MTQWPAARQNAMGYLPYRFTGYPHQYRQNKGGGARFGVFYGEEWAQTSASPGGYSTGGAYVLAIIAGGMSSWQAQFGLTGAASLLSASTLEGTANLTFTTDGNVGLIITLEGTGSATFTGAGNAALSVSLAGDGSFSLAGDGSLSMIVPLDGAGSFAFTGAAIGSGLLSLEGSFGGAEALSPQGLANAVWNSLSTEYNVTGTMGALLNASGAAGDPWAVTLEGTYTAADLIRLIAAVNAGELSGATTTEVRIRDVSDTKDRVIATVDEFGNRSALVLDAA